MSPPGYPLAWLRPRSAASVSPGTVIVAPEITGGLVVTSDFFWGLAVDLGSARFRHHARLTRRQRTIAVVNSRVKRL